MGTKADVVSGNQERRQVEQSEARSYATSKHMIDVIETSAKKDTNIDRTFLRLARALRLKHEGMTSYAEPEESIRLTSAALPQEKKRCTC